MRLHPLLLLLLLGACVPGREAPPRSPAALAGCYEVHSSRFGWLTPAFALQVDSAPGAAVLRVELDTLPARDAWESPAYLARFPRVTGSSRAFWQPLADGGLRITFANVDDGSTMELSPTRAGGLVGTDEAWGTVENAGQHARVAARRVRCDGFVPGYDAGSRGLPP